MDKATLPNDPEELKSIILDLDARNRSQSSRIEHLEEWLRLLQKEIFGRSSEKRTSSEDPRQLHLFNEAEANALQEPEEEKPQTIPEHTRSKPKRRPLPKELPRVEVIHDVDESEKVCPCGAELSRIGEEVCEKLDIIPATVRVIRHVRYKYACKGCGGVESEGQTVKVAPPPAEIIPKGMATAGLIAHVAVSKYADALPLYRQEKIFARYGIDISRATMSGWMVKAAERAAPLTGLLQKMLLSGPLVNADETPVQVLNEPGRKNTANSYMWVFRGGPPDKPVILFHYSPTRAGEIPRQVLGGYTGYLQCDAFSAYDGLEGQVRLVGCFAHARRYFVKVIDARGKSARKKTGSAEVALEYIGKLYKVEKLARERNLSPDGIKELREEKSAPLLAEFKEWMEHRVRQTPPKGYLGKALSYALSNWPRLIRYLEDGHITPDNNAAENAIRPFVVGRKNWLFAGHPKGAHAAEKLFSLIETAKACGLEPYHYLRFIFEKIPLTKTEEDFTALLPQRLTPEQLAGSMSYV